MRRDVASIWSLTLPISMFPGFPWWNLHPHPKFKISQIFIHGTLLSPVPKLYLLENRFNVYLKWKFFLQVGMFSFLLILQVELLGGDLPIIYIEETSRIQNHAISWTYSSPIGSLFNSSSFKICWPTFTTDHFENSSFLFLKSRIGISLLNELWWTQACRTWSMYSFAFLLQFEFRIHIVPKCWWCIDWVFAI